jgi:uncharacterized protein
MIAYPAAVHFNNLIRLIKTKTGFLILVWLAVSIACRSAASFDGSPGELPPSAEAEFRLAAPPDGTSVSIGVLLATPEPIPFPTLDGLEAVLPTLVAVPAGEVSETLEETEPDLLVEGGPPFLEAEPGGERPLSPYHHLSIAYLLERSYGGGELQVHQVMGREDGFTRYLISYPSDDLVIYGFANVPTHGSGPFPVVIALHGYVDPWVYKTLAYTTLYADTLAQAGFIVLHPNLRNYPPSSSGDNLFRVGMAVDVLNLIEIMKDAAGHPGPFENAMPDTIGLWGHSMGGGISLRVSVVNPAIKATVLYGAMSGDERQNFEAIYEWSNNQRGLAELLVPVEELEQIAPIYYLDRIQAAVSIHHGDADQMVPLQWSLDLCRDLIELGIEPECFTYPGQRHTFNQAGNQVFMERVIDFFVRHLEH